MRAERAPAPSNIIWENLEVGKCESFWRSALTLFIVLVLLLASYGLIFGLKVLIMEMPDPSKCDNYINKTLSSD